MFKTFKSSRIRTINRRPRLTTLEYSQFRGTSKRAGHEVPGVVAVLCESIAGPHQLIAAKKLNLLNQIKKTNRDRDLAGSCRTWLIETIIYVVLGCPTQSG